MGNDIELPEKTYKGGIIVFVTILLFEFIFLCFLVYNTINGTFEIFHLVVIGGVTIWVMMVTLIIMYSCTIFGKIIIDDRKITLDAVLVRQIIPIGAFEDARIDLWWYRHIRIYIMEKIYIIWIKRKTREGIIKIIAMSKNMNNDEKDKLLNKIQWIYDNIFYGFNS